MDRRYCEDSRHNMIRKNVLMATRTFDNRGKELMKHIVMSKENPLNVKFFNYRIEFQARGAAHIHGVLWVDFERRFPQNLNSILLKSSFLKFKNDHDLTEAEEQEVIKFIDMFFTYTLNKDEAKKLLIRECGDKDAVAARAVDIAETVNKHRNNKSCRKYNTTCRFNSPKLPSVKTLLTKNPDMYYKEELSKLEKIDERDEWINKKMAINKKIIGLVKEVLSQYDDMESDDVRLIEMKQKSTEEAIIYLLMNENINKLIAQNENILKRYEEALISSGHKSKSIILRRHPNERFQNNYNPEWIFAWNGNIDIQITLDFFEIVTNITEYYSKDDSGIIEYLKKAKKEMVDLNIQKQFRQMANVFLSHRRIGEAAALYRIIPDMHLSESNVKCVFVTTGWPETRYRFAKRISEDANDARFAEDESVMPITDRTDLYREATTLLDYYQMRSAENHADKICYVQFCQDYDPQPKKV